MCCCIEIQSAVQPRRQGQEGSGGVRIIWPVNFIGTERERERERGRERQTEGEREREREAGRERERGREVDHPEEISRMMSIVLVHQVYM